jgi:hypothetical protein
MDFSAHIEKIVESLVTDITSNVLVRVDSVISNAINNRLTSYDFASHIQDAATAAFEKKVGEYNLDPKKLENRVVDKIRETISTAQENTQKLVNEKVQESLAKTDFQQAITDSVGTLIADRMSAMNFPTNSINLDAINFTDLRISGNQVSGGIIENFSSTGIDDRASQVALTILDDSTVVENNLLTKDLTVQGQMTINGNFVVNGNVPEDSEFFRTLVSQTSARTFGLLDDNLFSNYSSIIFNKIKNDGLDLNKITLNGAELVTDNSLGPAVINSKLQTLGELRELRVSGESLLGQTLYVTPKRVGINTIEPAAALSVWDEEIEITAKKKSKDVAFLGTTRQQKLVLSANNKDNLTCNEDGSVEVEVLRMGPFKFSTSPTPPNYVSERCHVVWNTNPNPGGPMGWICLGSANWANFGIID